MEETTRLLYEAPATKVLELRHEGIICVSSDASFSVGDISDWGIETTPLPYDDNPVVG